MARGRIYRSEVQAARDALLREGTNPSLDAVRIALGNTGSKTTIHRLMKELEAEETSATRLTGEAISDALQTLVGQLSAQLRDEAATTIAAAKARTDEQIATAQAEVATLTRQAREGSDHIQRLQTDLDDARRTLKTTEQALRERDTVIVGLRERLAGIERQLGEREAHLASVETKHQQARDALDHFRQASKEQWEIEARQHEQAVQSLQVELRRSSESMATKNAELLTLNRDNARLTEQAGQHNKDVRELRRELQVALNRAAEADALRQRNQSFERRVSQADADMEAMRREQNTARVQWDAERVAMSDALRDAKAQGERWSNIESILSSLQLRHDDGDPQHAGT